MTKYFLFFLLIVSIKINAQNADSVRVIKDTLSKPSPAIAKQQDSTPVKKKFIPVPKKALLYSIIPGGGQIYNRKLAWLKVPIVYGGFVGGGIAIYYNSTRYRYLKEQYYRKVNNLPLQQSNLFPFINNSSAANIKSARDGFFKFTQQSYIFTGVWYLLSGIEAFSAAHLMNFDVSDDLTMNVKPSFLSSPVGSNFGVGICLTLK